MKLGDGNSWWIVWLLLCKKLFKLTWWILVDYPFGVITYSSWVCYIKVLYVVGYQVITLLGRVYYYWLRERLFGIFILLKLLVSRVGNWYVLYFDKWQITGEMLLNFEWSYDRYKSSFFYWIGKEKYFF